MIGTTHFTNAVVQRRDLVPTAAIRLWSPATASVPPLEDWPGGVARGDWRHGLPGPRRLRV
ncbi:MAG: hypothetical protein U0841_04245 [Chloroflexia bacterium]